MSGDSSAYRAGEALGRLLALLTMVGGGEDVRTTVLDKTFVDKIYEIGMRRAPSEACGILLPTAHKGQRVWEMPNRHHEHHDHFEMSTDDVLMELGGWFSNNEELWGQVTVWHTHPEGVPGPSEVDRENRVEDCCNLIVALTESGPRPTWF